MKTIILSLIIVSLLGYVWCSLFFATWNPMEYSETGRYLFGAAIAMGLIAGCMIRALDMDKPTPTYHSPYDEVFGGKRKRY